MIDDRCSSFSEPPNIIAIPQTELGKLLDAIVKSVGHNDPRAFIGVDIAKAIHQADRLVNN